MIKKITILSAFAVASFLAIDSQFNVAISDSSGKSGYAGDPAGGSKTCAKAGCHDSYGTTSFAAPSNTISFKDASNNEVFYYTGGATYTVTINAQNTNSKAGFNCIIENGSGSKLGTFTAGTGTQLLNGYVSHNANGNAGANKSWTFTWVAPAAGSGALTIYAAVNRADNGFTELGDSIFATTRVLSDGANGINSIQASVLSINPNPASDKIMVNINEAITNANVAVYSLNGELLIHQNLTSAHQNLNVNDLNKGIYLVHVTNGTNSYIQKFIKD
ncbi:MAG: hypothetical protein RIQ33_1643 [Bacteroidota bacterium]|jgi:hypothetical protein